MKYYICEIDKNCIIKKLDNNSYISFLKDINNLDYKEYVKWLEEGNEAEILAIEEL